MLFMTYLCSTSQAERESGRDTAGIPNGKQHTLLYMSTFFNRIAAALALFCAALAASAQPRTLEYGHFNASDGFRLPYRIFIPGNCGDSPRPLLLFLHGAGERGCDNEAQLNHGKTLLLESPELEDVIIVAPQCPEESYWVDIVRPTTPEECAARTFPEDADITVPLRAVRELLDSLVASGCVNTERIYCTGLSMGGMGTLDLMLRYPSLFAAVEPICGAVNIGRLSGYSGPTAVRLFHGDCDETVPVHFSREAFDALREAGAEVEYVEYPGVWHNSWDNAFAEKDFLSWMLDRRLSDN